MSGIGMNTGLEGKSQLHDPFVFEKKPLRNGVTLWIQQPTMMPDRQGIVLACLPNVGSICDREGSTGTAHFFEHGPFLGTRNRRDYQALFRPVEDLGGEINAGTSKSFIRYFCTLPADRFELAAETTFEISTQPLLRAQDIMMERGTILNELEEKQSVGDYVRGTAVSKEFWEGHPLGNPVLGAPESIAAMTSKMLRDFFVRHFRTGNLHVVIGGAFAVDVRAIAAVERLYSELPASSANPTHNIPLPRIGRRLGIANPKFGKDNLVMAWATRRKFRYPFRLLAGHLAADMTSPLVAVLRQKMGAIYSKGWAQQDQAGDVVCLGISIPVAAQHFRFAEELVSLELEKITADDVVRRQRISQIGRDYNSVHPVEAVKNSVLDLCQSGRIISMREDNEERDRLTVEEVLEARDWVLQTSPFICETTIR